MAIVVTASQRRAQQQATVQRLRDRNVQRVGEQRATVQRLRDREAKRTTEQQSTVSRLRSRGTTVGRLAARVRRAGKATSGGRGG